MSPSTVGTWADEFKPLPSSVTPGVVNLGFALSDLLWLRRKSRRITMSRIVFNLFLLASLFSPGVLFSQTSAHPPLRIGIVGLVHGHVHGFLGESRHSPKIEIVGVAEPDRQLLAQAGTRYSFDRALFSPDLKEMLARAHPQAVLVYTNTYDHRRVVETCARHGVHVMMAQPLAVGLEDALAVEKAAHLGKIQVLVN